MPFVANTPESLIGRSDSKNPATTCRGVTSSGRPCRRPIAVLDTTSISNASLKAHLRADDPGDERLYCWQHKEQAALSARSSPGPRVSGTPVLEERTSLDTLADRLGLVARASTRLEKRRKDDGRHGHGGRKHGQTPRLPRTKPKKQAVFCCCFRIPAEEILPPPRPRPRPLQTPLPTSPPGPSTKSAGKKSSGQHLAPATPSPSRPPRSATSAHSSTGRRSSQTSTQLALSASSQTAQYMSLIPVSASPQTASLLLAELAKTVSRQDEPGYIYMFWLTPEAKPATSDAAETARSLLLAPPARPSTSRRRTSEVLASFAVSENTGGGGSNTRGASRSGQIGSEPDKKKILLKIGRANNVQRRLNEWQRQCGYDLSLIRYYPYIPASSAEPNLPASPSASAGALPRKMPHSHKVERLIHIELAGLGLRVADRERCAACGREHREWFAVEATRRAVAAVDEVVRRWVDWDEAAG